VNNNRVRESDSDAPYWNGYWSDKSSDDIVLKESAETWHELQWRINLQRWADIFQRFASGNRLLEYGCGSAKISQYMALRGYQCTMLDQSEAALSLARSSFKSLSLAGTFVLGNIRQMDFGNNEFDIAYSGGVLQYFSDPYSAIKEVVRVIRPGGLFAVDIIPRKFSCQTIGDIERTIAHLIKSVLKRKFAAAIRLVRHLPPGVRGTTLRDYIRCCQSAGLVSINGRGVSPFPALSLGAAGNRMYMRFMQRHLDAWLRFNHSASRWTEIWGIAYAIYGSKGSDSNMT
jgi:ubiquinone/menaquinone biosynthesis C-methylase UbiE